MKEVSLPGAVKVAILPLNAEAASEISPPITSLLAIFLVWIAVTAASPYFNRIIDFNHINRWIWPAVRMTLMLLVTMLYATVIERRRLAEGFNIRFRDLRRSFIWAVAFFVVALVVVGAYERYILTPLTSVSTASSVTEPEPIQPFMQRLIEYLYILFEGIVETLVFIGFFLDRLARRMGWGWALLVSNIGFALWHYQYLHAGLAKGGMMMALTFIAGTVISLSYLKTRNSLSPAICHTLVDLASEIKPLLGLG